MASLMYNEGVARLLQGYASSINFSDAAQTMKIAAVNASYVANKDDQFESAITSYRIGTDQTLGTRGGPTKDTATDRINWTAANPTWTSLAAGSTIEGFVIYRDTGGGASTNPLMCYIDVTATPTNGGNITLDFQSAAVFYLQQ